MEEAPGGCLADPESGALLRPSSLNLNLRIAGGQFAGADLTLGEGVPPIKAAAVSLFVIMGTSYLQVVHYGGRYFLRDGYHRAAGLLRAGVTVVPCVFIDAQAFEEVGAQLPGAFSYEILYGDRPPRLTDFWDNAVARDVRQPAVRKVVRVRGEEFVVQG